MNPIYPFKFLDAYTAQDKHIFFGRKEEIDALYEMVFQADLILVYGASGTGKSSLIQCGLANKFQTHDWLPLPIRRGTDINASLEKAIEDAGGKLASDEMDVLDEEDNLDSPSAKKFKAVYLKHFKPIYLIFDQFEELYILGTKEEQRIFIEKIKEILRIEQPIKIIFSIREEYLGYLYEFEKAVPELLRKKLRIEPMNLDRVKQVLLGVHRLENSLVTLEVGKEASIAEQVFEKIKGDSKTLSIQLPYLQVFLDKFYLTIAQDEKREKKAVFTEEALANIGNMGDILGDFLNEQAEKIARTHDQKTDFIWAVLSSFVTLEGTKEPLSLVQLAGIFADLPADFLQIILQSLVNSRILRLMENELLYEIAHDSLAKQIANKRTDDQIAVLEVQRLVKTQSLAKADVREHFTERQLAFIEPYLTKFLPTAQEKEWIEESREFRKEARESEAKRQHEELKRAKRRLRVVVSLSIFVFLGLFGASWASWIAYQLQKNINKAEKNVLQVKEKIDNLEKIYKITSNFLKEIIEELDVNDSCKINKIITQKMSNIFFEAFQRLQQKKLNNEDSIIVYFYTHKLILNKEFKKLKEYKLKDENSFNLVKINNKWEISIKLKPLQIGEYIVKDDKLKFNIQNIIKNMSDLLRKKIDKIEIIGTSDAVPIAGLFYREKEIKSESYIDLNDGKKKLANIKQGERLSNQDLAFLRAYSVKNDIKQVLSTENVVLSIYLDKSLSNPDNRYVEIKITY